MPTENSSPTTVSNPTSSTSPASCTNRARKPAARAMARDQVRRVGSGTWAPAAWIAMNNATVETVYSGTSSSR